jgi:hypothetical protein
MKSMNANRFSLATLCGLLLALLVPLLPLLLHPGYRGAVPTHARIVWGLIHWINLFALLTALLFWERRRLDTIGIRAFQWITLVWGAAGGRRDHVDVRLASSA